MSNLGDLLAEHRPNVVTEGAGTIWQTRVKCDGRDCEFYFAHRGGESDPTGYYGATQAHTEHLEEVVGAYLTEEREKAFAEAQEAVRMVFPNIGRYKALHSEIAKLAPEADSGDIGRAISHAREGIIDDYAAAIKNYRRWKEEEGSA